MSWKTLFFSLLPHSPLLNALRFLQIEAHSKYIFWGNQNATNALIRS